MKIFALSCLLAQYKPNNLRPIRSFIYIYVIQAIFTTWASSRVVMALNYESDDWVFESDCRDTFFVFLYFR